MSGLSSDGGSEVCGFIGDVGVTSADSLAGLDTGTGIGVCGGPGGREGRGEMGGRSRGSRKGRKRDGASLWQVGLKGGPGGSGGGATSSLT